MSADADISSKTKSLLSTYSIKFSKRAARCQVDNCDRELPQKAYYRRYRICEHHASLPKSIINGQCFRFCQYCGRFQSIEEFDGEKRSCRVALEKHRGRTKQRYHDKKSQQAMETTCDSVKDSPSAGSDVVISGSTHALSNSEKSLGESCDMKSALIDSNNGHIAPKADTLLPLNMTAPMSFGLPEVYKVQATDGDVLNMDGTLGHDNNGNVFVPCCNSPGANGFDTFFTGNGFPLFPIPTLPPLPAMQGPAEPGLLPRSFNADQEIVAMSLPKSIEDALDLLAKGEAGLLPSSSGTLSSSNNNEMAIERMSLKIFNCSPDILPTDVRQALADVLMKTETETSMSLNIRAGCVCVTADILMTKAEAARLRAEGPAPILEHVIACKDRILPQQVFDGPKGIVTAQVHDSLAVADKNGVRSTSKVKPSDLPNLVSLVPLAIEKGRQGSILLFGHNIIDHSDLIVCRKGQETLNLDIPWLGETAHIVHSNEHAENLITAGLSAGSCIEINMPLQKRGLYCVEIQRNSLLSRTLPFLVLEKEAVKEIRQLETNSKGVADVFGFVFGVGFILEFLESDRMTRRKVSADVKERIATLAASTALVCIKRGWPALLSKILPAIDVYTASIYFSSQGDSNILLALAMSKSTASVDALREWSRRIGFTFVCSVDGSAQATPLHLAALLDDDAIMAKAITSLLLPGEECLWHMAKDAGGLTPATVAKIVGNNAVLEWLENHKAYAEEELVGLSAAKETLLAEDTPATAERNVLFTWKTMGAIYFSLQCIWACAFFITGLKKIIDSKF